METGRPYSIAHPRLDERAEGPWCANGDFVPGSEWAVPAFSEIAATISEIQKTTVVFAEKEKQKVFFREKVFVL